MSDRPVPGTKEYDAAVRLAIERLTAIYMGRTSELSFALRDLGFSDTYSAIHKAAIPILARQMAEITFGMSIITKEFREKLMFGE